MASASRVPGSPPGRGAAVRPFASVRARRTRLAVGFSVLGVALLAVTQIALAPRVAVADAETPRGGSSGAAGSPGATVSWDPDSGRNLPAPLVFTHDGHLWRWMPGEHAPVEFSGSGWARPLSPVAADASGETFYFAAYAVTRTQGRVGVNINISNIFRQTPRELQMITRDWDVASSPDISRDNRTLVFTSNHHAMLREVLPGSVSTEIYILQRPWLLPKRLTMDGGFKFHPRLSPDGTRVAYTWMNGSEVGLWVHDLEARRARRIGPAADHPTWTPDGSAVTAIQDGRLWTIPVDGGAPSPVAAEPEGVYVSHPRWTDHGLLYAWSRSGRSGISLWDPRSRSARVLVSGPGEFGGADLADRE